MSTRRLLVCDIDGTLLENSRPTAGLKALSARIRGERSRIRLIYATGRTFASTWSLVAQGTLPRPDAVASQVGSEVWLPPFNAPHTRFASHIAPRWDVGVVERVTRRHPELVAQKRQFQTPYKLSYLVDEGCRDLSSGLHKELSSHGVDAKILYSGRRFVDILPARAGKRGAVSYLSSFWGGNMSILACGDSGNDLDLLSDPRVKGVVVGNASDGRLTDLRGDWGIFRSRFPFAAGVLDGALHFGFFATSLSLYPRSHFPLPAGIDLLDAVQGCPY